MTKADLVAKIAEDAGITKVQAGAALESFTNQVAAALKSGDKITLTGFGTFSASSRAARIGRNPQTGAALNIAAKTNGKFTPGKDLKDLAPKPVEPAKTTKPAKAAKPATKVAPKKK